MMIITKGVFVNFLKVMKYDETFLRTMKLQLH